MGGPERSGGRAGLDRRPSRSHARPMARLLLLALALAGCELAQSDASPERPAPSKPAADAADGPERPRGAAPTVVGGEDGGLRLALPTDNRGVFEGRPEDFYMGLTMTIDSLREERWEGGQYGFVRDEVPTVFGRRTFRRVHEGVDIAPVGRDRGGNPVDTVRTIDDGRVAYVNASAGASSYGKYVVVEHTWSDSPVYSLYAHLSETYVTAGQAVRQSAPVGKMGYTGRGLGRDRAHVHLEIAFMVNEHEPLWFAEYFGGNDLHGRFFGTNLAGVPPAELYLALREDPTLTFPEFVRSLDEGYVVDLPGRRPLDLIRRYPWLGAEAARADPASVPAWRIAFTQEGAPIRVEVGDVEVDRPTVEGVSLGIWLTDGSTNQMLRRRGLGYEPTRRGTNYFALYATTADGAPRW